jgi:amino acid transporter
MILSARVIQELAKDGIMPFSNLFMQNKPFRTPIWALLLHLGVTIIFICAPPAGDAFSFIVSLSTYPGVVILTAITVGLVKLRLSPKENFVSPQRAPWAVVIVYLAANIVSLFYKENMSVICSMSHNFFLVSVGHALCSAA